MLERCSRLRRRSSAGFRPGLRSRPTTQNGRRTALARGGLGAEARHRQAGERAGQRRPRSASGPVAYSRKALTVELAKAATPLAVEMERRRELPFRRCGGGRTGRHCRRASARCRRTCPEYRSAQMPSARSHSAGTGPVPAPLRHPSDRRGSCRWRWRRRCLLQTSRRPRPPGQAATAGKGSCHWRTHSPARRAADRRRGSRPWSAHPERSEQAFLEQLCAAFRLLGKLAEDVRQRPVSAGA